MSTNWQTHLQQSGASIEANALTHFQAADDNNPALDATTFIVPLVHYGVISVSGDDAEDFLQNQLSNDIRLVDDQHSQLSSYCNPKGRMLASFRVFRFNDQLNLRLSLDTLPATLKRMSMFVLRSQVTLVDNSQSLCGLGIVGQHATDILNTLGLPVPSEVNEVSQSPLACVIRVPGSQPRYEIYTDETNIIALWDQCMSQARPATSSDWILQDIEAGLPDITANTVEAFVPQMTNMHAIGGVSFKKGCYPGQEVVARMQYLGKLKRRMYHAQAETEQLPQPGDNLYSSGSEESVGKVVSAVKTNNSVELLAVLQIAQAEQHTIFLSDKRDVPVKIIDLPYTVPLEREK